LGAEVKKEMTGVLGDRLEFDFRTPKKGDLPGADERPTLDTIR
jgi:hypothetical protein